MFQERRQNDSLQKLVLLSAFLDNFNPIRAYGASTIAIMALTLMTFFILTTIYCLFLMLNAPRRKTIYVVSKTFWPKLIIIFHSFFILYPIVSWAMTITILTVTLVTIYLFLTLIYHISEFNILRRKCTPLKILRPRLILSSCWYNINSVQALAITIMIVIMMTYYI
jgi:hypothetical protein